MERTNRYILICVFTYIHIQLQLIEIIIMANLTLSVPKELKDMMEKFPEINWSEVARDSIKKKIAQLNFLKGFRIDSEIDPEDALDLGKEISELLLKRYKSE